MVQVPAELDLGGAMGGGRVLEEACSFSPALIFFLLF